MKTLSWKPLKSSVKQARSLTEILETINVIISGLIVLAALIALFGGQVVAALICFVIGVVAYLIFKMSYIALELLTEIADDTRLQLLAVVGEDCDYVLADNSSESTISKDSVQAAEIYNAAVKGYRMTVGRVATSFDESTIVTPEKVILRDSSGSTIVTMVLYGGAWLRE